MSPANPPLNWLRVGADASAWGRLFHWITVRGKKLNLNASVSFRFIALMPHFARRVLYNYNDHIFTEGGHAEHVLITGTRWMPDLLTNNLLRFRRCPVTFAQ